MISFWPRCQNSVCSQMKYEKSDSQDESSFTTNHFTIASVLLNIIGCFFREILLWKWRPGQNFQRAWKQSGKIWSETTSVEEAEKSGVKRGQVRKRLFNAISSPLKKMRCWIDYFYEQHLVTLGLLAGGSDINLFPEN